MPAPRGRFAAVLEVVGWRLPIALALVAAYLIAAPGTVNPAVPEEAAAAAVDTCTGLDSSKTLSVRADGGRYFILGCTGLTNVSASCGTVTDVSYFIPIYRFESGSCLGPATFSWETEGTPHVQNMKIEANGNEPPECGPPDPGTTVLGIGIRAELSISCRESDFDASGLDQLQSSTTDPVHGFVRQNLDFAGGFLGGSIFYEYEIDFPETLLVMRCDDSFAITIGDDYGPNPKSLPPVNIFVDNSGQRPPGICPEASAEPTGRRAAALKKCKKTAKKKDWTKKKLRKCKKKARLLPV